MKKHVNYFLIVAFVLIAGFALVRGNVFSSNAAEQTKENVTVCENGHTPANEWVIKRYARFNSDGERVKLCKAFTPQVQVTDSNGKKIAASNYTMRYYDNVWPGRAVAKVTFKGNYRGTIERGFKIYLGKVTLIKVENTAWGTRMVWSTPGNRSYAYQIYRSINGGKYELLFTSMEGGQSFLDQHAKTPGVKYTYKVDVICYPYGDDVYGSASMTPPKSVVCKEKRLSTPSVTNTSKGVKVSWKWVPYATYYEVRGSGYKDSVLRTR